VKKLKYERKGNTITDGKETKTYESIGLAKKESANIIATHGLGSLAVVEKFTLTKGK